jgi:hypothetical protein
MLLDPDEPALDDAAAPADEDQDLPEDQQRRGRRVALLSHPFSMTYRMATGGGLATQALVSLGASEALVGLQASLAPFATLIQLPGLRLVARLGKRGLLLLTQVLALLCGLPLLYYGRLLELGPSQGPAVLLASLAGTMLMLLLGSTAWWPLLHGFTRRGSTGRFFAALRTSWHLGLIGFFLFSAWWLSGHPGGFGLLFAIAWACGAARALLIPLFPERPERVAFAVREALGRVVVAGPLRQYTVGVTLDQIVFRAVPPFLIVLLRREVHLTEAQVLVTTLATYVGGLLALHPAGALADRLGARPMLVATCALRAAVVLSLGLAAWLCSAELLLPLVAGLTLAYSMLVAAFGVAEVKLLFRLAEGASPTPAIVGTVVARNLVAGVVVVTVGLVLEQVLRRAADPLGIYLGFFGLAAAIQLAAGWPLWRVAQPKTPLPIA